MAETFVRVDRAGTIATVTLTRAERRNAVTPTMMRQLIEAAQAFHDDEETRAIVIRAEGRDFSVGADLARPNADGPPPSMLMRRRAAELGASLMRALQEIPQPTICAVQGVATGAGACIATACDFRVAAETARLGYGEVKLGINLMWRAAPACVRLVGPARAKRLIMSGRLFDAATLERWGFIDEVVSGRQPGRSRVPVRRGIRRPAAPRGADDQAEHRPDRRRDRPGDHARGHRPVDARRHERGLQRGGLGLFRETKAEFYRQLIGGDR